MWSSNVRRLAGASSGNVAVIFALLFLPVLLLVGGGVDMALHERERIRLQDALDAGLIAAAALNQPNIAETTVRRYVDAAGFKNYTLDVSETKTVSSRTVVASATLSLPTHFMKIARIDELTVTASGAAEEAVRNIEISFVLDLSGSMHEGSPTSRVAAMRPAAKNFIGQLINEKTKPYTTISLIPFAGQVNVGAAAFDALMGDPKLRTHDRSSCFSNLDKTFSKAIPDFSKATQVPQFSSWYLGTNKINGKVFDPWNCPTEETSISYISNDAKALQDRIDGYHLFDGTATHIAMKWGLHLLDPDFRARLSAARAQGVELTSPGFSNRPDNFKTGETLKVIVLMTDGQIVAQQRPKTSVAPCPAFAPNPAGVYPQFPEKNSEGKTVAKSCYLNENVVSASEAVATMIAACNAAKDNGIVIYTIAFAFGLKPEELAAKAKVKACASGDDKFYEAGINDIDKIFQDVARNISPLRLTN